VLKALVSKLKSLIATDTASNGFTVNNRPAPGFVYSFLTSPYSDFAPRYTGRYAAFKIIGATPDLFVIAVYDGIWSSHPSMAEFRKAQVLQEHRFAHTGREAIFGTHTQWWDVTDFEDLAVVGFQAPSAHETNEVSKIFDHVVGSRTASTKFTNYAAEGEWRWKNDRAAFEDEKLRNDAKNEADRKAKEERYKNRLSKLTWDQLLSEKLFEKWTPSPPYPPAEFTNSARAKIREVCVELQSLGAKPKKADVRRILKECVFWFNEADEKAGHVIETEEREDICAVLEEITFVARHKNLIEEVDEWRDW
jgi:hypothetical protein